MAHNAFNTLKTFQPAAGKTGQYYSLPALAKTFPNVKRLPVSIRIVLESVLRNVDGKKVTEEHVKQLANWQAKGARTDEIPFILARIVLQDFTGVPLLADLAAMRSVAAEAWARTRRSIEPLVPVDLVVDHSVQIDHYGAPNVLDLNMKLEFSRNRERYQFMKWGMQAFDTFKVVPPGIGIVHQVNLEYLARGVFQKDGMYYPDTLVGTDSHTTMINGIGVVGWGVGGIEAEAGMLGQPVYFLTPDVVGVNLTGALREGVTATDLVLTVTEMLRKAKVVGKFVEFFGEGTRVARRARPRHHRQHGARVRRDHGLLPGRREDHRLLPRHRPHRRGGARRSRPTSRRRACSASRRRATSTTPRCIELDLDTVTPSVAGPKRPQDRIELGKLKRKFTELFSAAAGRQRLLQEARGPRQAREDQGRRRHRLGRRADRRDHLVHQHLEPERADRRGPAREEGGREGPHGQAAHQDLARARLARGDRVPQGRRACCTYLEKLGFYVSAYGCTTCIGNAGPLAEPIDEAIVDNDLVCAAVLSGNRNFEARIHPNLRANFLASPPLVVAYAIAGTVLKDLETEPLGTGKRRQAGVPEGHLAHQRRGAGAACKYSRDPAMFRAALRRLHQGQPDVGRRCPTATGQVYNWPKSTYIAEPPFFKDFGMSAGKAHDVKGARALGDPRRLGHHRPHLAGRLDQGHLARGQVPHRQRRAEGRLQQLRRAPRQPRGDDARHLRQRAHQEPDAAGRRPTARASKAASRSSSPRGEQMSIYDAAMKYIAAGHAHGRLRRRGVRLGLVARLGGQGHGAPRREGGRACAPTSASTAPTWSAWACCRCSSRARTRRRRSASPARRPSTWSASRTASRPQMDVTLVIHRKDGTKKEVPVLLRIDTPIEVDYYLHGGILPFVLRELVAKPPAAAVTA